MAEGDAQQGMLLPTGPRQTDEDPDARRRRLEVAKAARRLRPPLQFYAPHTPRDANVDDSRQPSCSAPSKTNKGCDGYARCIVREMRDRNRGPVQVVVENYMNVQMGEGTRRTMWCFDASTRVFGHKPVPNHALIPSRVYEAMEGETRVVKTLPPYEEQGPYYRPLQTQAAPDILDERRAAEAEALARGD